MRQEEINELLEEAKFYILNNRFKEAEKYLQKILEKYPQHVEALFYMGLLNELLNKLTAAREYYQKVLELSPNHERAEEYLSRLQGK